MFCGDCDGCKHFGVKDAMWRGEERHDDYCFKFNEWRPDGCDTKEWDDDETDA